MTLDSRLTELVAIGASAAANCSACLEHHLGKAGEAGVDAGEIAAAFEVGRMVRRGAASTLDKVAARLGAATPAAAATAGRGCGCA